MIATESPEVISIESDLTCWPGQWFIASINPSRVDRLIPRIEILNVRTYYPRGLEWRTYGGKRQRIETPLFKGYLFCRAESEYVQTDVRFMPWVKQIIEPKQQERLTRELRQFQIVEQLGTPITLNTKIIDGVTVEVQSGPYRGVIGVVSRQHKGRLFLNCRDVAMAGEFEIDAAVVQVIED